MVNTCRHENESRRSLYPRDGIRAWLVCFCTVIYNIVVFGCTKTFGVVYPVLLDEFKQGKVKTAWVGSLLVSLSFTLTMVATKLIQRFGVRIVGISGGVFAAVGCLATSFVNSIELMYLTYSLVVGLAASLCMFSNVYVIHLYFKKRLGFAMGFTMAGNGAAYMVMAPIIETLVSNFGWRNAFRTISAMSLIGAACSMTFSPHVESDNESDMQRVVMEGQWKSLLKNIRLLACCLASFLFVFGIMITVFHLGRYAQESGCSLSQVAMLYVGFGVCTVFGRVIIGRIIDLNVFRLSYLLVVLALLLAFSNFLCPFAKTFDPLLVYACVSGFCDGCYATAMLILVRSSTAPSQRPYALSLLFLTIGISCAISPPAAGFVAETTSSYTPVFYCTGSIVLLSAAISSIIECFKLQTCHGTQLILTCETLDDTMIITEKVTVL